MFAQRLKKARKDKGLTQLQLANSLNLSRTTISGWEISQYYPTMEALVRICKELDVSADYLFGIEYKSFINVNDLSSDFIPHLQSIADYMKAKNHNV